MGLVTLGAVHAAVASVVGPGKLMTAAALTSGALATGSMRVRVMTAHAPPTPAQLRMIRMNVRMALGTRQARGILYVVWRVTAGAVVVSRDMAAPEQGLVLVTRATIDGLLGPELVRSVTPEAFGVPAGEQRRFGHYGLVLLVAIDARGARVCCRRVLVLVAGAARFSHGLARTRVCRRNVLVTIAARRAARGLLRVGPMTAQTILRAMHLYRWKLALGGRMTTLAVGRGERGDERGLTSPTAPA
jgi:hypothetical protein